MAVKVNLELLLKGLKEYFSEVEVIKEKIEEMKSGGFEFGILLACLKDGARLVDQIAKDSTELVSSSTKKEALSSFLDEVIQLPFLFDKILNVDGLIIGGLIDGYVHLMNSKFGKEWSDKVESIF